MPIAALTQDTARVITSTLALTDAVSVVKELLDNALDARADTISVEISANTLDLIQVKDNGIGIGVEDRQLLCKRGCTSKIRSIEDLASLGGNYLGFRGEALASVAELSGSVTITTRVDGELVGSALKYGAAGKLSNSVSASHPVGTTVRIQDFLKAIPVRKQSALKALAKTIASLRQMLFSYAFARSEVRFSFKVLKGKNDKANWAYAPTAVKSSLSEVVTKIVGKEVAAQCQQHSSKPATSSEAGLGHEWALEGSMVSSDSDPQSIGSTSQFISIDGRPVSAERGLIRNLVKLYKQYLNHALISAGQSSPISKPFLFLRIRCPLMSYDVNIEPAKDEVLFLDPTVLETMFEKFLIDVYGEKPSRHEASSSAAGSGPKKLTTIPFEMLLARKPQADPLSTGNSVSNIVNFHETKTMQTPGTTQNPLDSNAQTQGEFSDESIESANHHPNRFADHRIALEANLLLPDRENSNELEMNEAENIGSASVTNPWSLAKMNALIVPGKMPAFDDQLRGPRSGGMTSPETTVLETPASTQTQVLSHRTPLGQRIQLPTPVVSPDDNMPYQNPGPPMRRRAPVTDEPDEEFITPPPSSSASVRHGQGTISLDAWVRPNNNISQTLDSDQLESRSSQSGGSKSEESFTSQTKARQDILSNLVSVASRNVENGTCSSTPHVFRPFKSPVKSCAPNERTSNPDSNVLPKHSTGADEYNRAPTEIRDFSSVAQRALKPPHVDRSHFQQLPTATLVQQPESTTTPNSHNAELDEIMDFEHRKRIVIANQRRQAVRGALNDFKPTSILSKMVEPLQNRPSDGISAAKSQAVVDGINMTQTEDFEARFGRHKGGGQPFITSQKAQSNPHHNRYVAAKRDLSRPFSTTVTAESPITSQIQDPNEEFSTPEPNIADMDNDETPAIPESDPRGYLMAHLRSHADTKQQEPNLHQPGQGGRKGLLRTGLKIRRTKTSRLPLETVAASTQTHRLSTTLAQINDCDELEKQADALAGIDEYVPSGQIQGYTWSPFSTEVAAWEARLHDLVSSSHQSSMVGGKGKEVVEIEIGLPRAIKAHVESSSGKGI